MNGIFQRIMMTFQLTCKADNVVYIVQEIASHLKPSCPALSSLSLSLIYILLNCSVSWKFYLLKLRLGGLNKENN